MKITEADVIWFTKYHPAPTGVATVRVEWRKSNWERHYDERWMPAHSLGEWGQVETDTLEKKLLGMFILFNTIVVRDGGDPMETHKAFLKIDEYREAISPDAPGASA